MLFSACDQQEQHEKKVQQYAAQMEQVERLLSLASRCDSLGVQKLFGDSSENIGQYEKNINNAVLRLYQLLKKYDLPKAGSYKFHAYADKHPRLVDVEISFPQNKKFLVEFVKYNPVEVFNFTELEKPFDPTKTVASKP